MQNPKFVIWMAGALCNLLKHLAPKHLHQMVSAEILDIEESSFHKTKQCRYAHWSSLISSWGLSGIVAAPTITFTSDCATGDPQSV